MSAIEKIKLVTGKNRDLVSYVGIAPFVTKPEVVTWGIRTFIRQENGEYLEAFHVAALHTWSEKDKCWLDAATNQPVN